MEQVTSLKAMQDQALKARKKGRAIGFVPTMGYLHDGHMSLVRTARRLVGKDGLVVVSIYVNPTQFAPHEDLSRYPRDLDRDQKLCEGEGVDVLFYPTDAAMYPQKKGAAYSTYVVEEKLSRPMEGIARPTHFRGVTTIVAKLFNLVQPTVAVFGQKDFQQAAVIQRMVRDLNFPIRIVVAKTRREKDGLAMSSRNKYLSPEERAGAICLWKAIQEARTIVATRGTITVTELTKHLINMLQANPHAQVDYISFFDPKTLRAASQVNKGTHMALAVFIGKTRLIDNGRL